MAAPMTQAPRPPKQFRGLKIALAATVALAGATVVTLIAAIVLFATVWSFPSGDDDRFAPDHLDAERAATAFASRDVTIPAEFEFVSATHFPVFTGKDSYVGRYRIDASLNRAEELVARSNPAILPFYELARPDPSQVDPTRIAMRPWPPGQPDLADPGTLLGDVNPPPDSETLTLVDRSTHVELIVDARGH